jgi:hypothetical protein
VNVSPLLIAHTQPSKLIQPSEGALDNPTPSSQATTMFGIAFGKKRNDTSGTQASPDRRGVIATISGDAIWAVPRATAIPLQLRNGIDECKRLLRVVSIGAG